jgi:triacylglycerol lipase
MMHSILLAFILVTATLSASQPASQSAPKVTVTNGTYAGIHSTTFNQDVFLGIPFAQPPSSPGSLRFRRPLSLNSTWSGTRYATEFGYDCPS